MKRRVVLFNGPPSCGKDTAAIGLFERLTYQRLGLEHELHLSLERFSMPNKRAFAGMMGLNISTFGVVEVWEARKEEIIPSLGISYRQWQIDFSERFMKPLYGQAIFGQLLAERWLRRTVGLKEDQALIIPDSGFKSETEVLLRRGWDILLIRIHRPGTDFSKDSRSYLEFDPRPNLLQLDIQNDGTEADFQAHIVGVFQSWMKSLS